MVGLNKVPAVPALLAGCAVVVLVAGPVAAQTTVHTQPFESMSPWEEYHPSETTADWSIVSSGSYPSCSPHEGGQMARFNSYAAYSGDEARIESPGLDITGNQVVTCRFWMYRNNSDSSHNDYVRFQISTDGGERFYTIREMYRYNATTGWEEKVVHLGQYGVYPDFRIALRGESRYGNNIFIDDLRVTKDDLAAGVEGADCTAAGDCDSGICGQDPGGNGRCREAGTTCIDGDRQPVSSGTVVCYQGDVATCNGTDDWGVQDCFDDCGPYLDVHACEMGECAACEEFCDPFFDTGCDPDAYCAFSPFPIPRCFFKGDTGDGCTSNDQCISGNCVSSPSGEKFCEPSGTPCAADDGSPVDADTSVCQGNDRAVCQAGGGWSVQDCYTNCGFYQDVDQCAGGQCAACATSCDGDEDCKSGILCVDNQCVGDLPNGSTCTLDTQCASDHCVHGYCCNDLCSARCFRCDLDGLQGTCTPVPAGQDPGGDCTGDPLCSGTCDGSGVCDYPGQQTICDTCMRCDGVGRCLVPIETGDPADECPPCQACAGGAGCQNVSAGTDPLDDCEQQPPESCGLNGACDGQGACAFWPEETECGVGSCTDAQASFPDTCDGAGRCIDGGSGSCGMYRCADATRCADSCTTHAQCIPAAYCAAEGTCEPDLGEGTSCDQVVYPGQIDDAACMGGYCFEDDFDGQGAFCTADPAACVHDGMGFQAGYVLCWQDDWFRTCIGGAQGWSEAVSCEAGQCDAGGGAGSGIRAAGSCASGPGGGCASTCSACEPYMAESDTSCRTSCSLASHCWPGYECRGGQCQIPEGIGEPCESQADCTAGTCVDGVCCIDSCLGPCRACNLPGHLGFCTLAEAGSDPDDDCARQSEESCGTTGACDGRGVCAMHPAGTSCGQARCDGDLLVSASVCNGSGVCLEGGVTDCRPGRCRQGACTSGCSTHLDCVPEGFCGEAGSCQADLPDGAACDGVVLAGLAADPACIGGFCFADTFNESGAYCAGAADACVAAGSVYRPGHRLCHQDGQPSGWYRVCLGGEAGWGGEVACAPADFCDAGGGPASGVRPEEICTDGPLGGCSADCISCHPFMAEQAGMCATSCVEDAGCWPGFICDAGDCVPVAGLGDACVSQEDCPDLFCVDQVCCNRPCDGPCEVCNHPDAPGACVYVQPGTDPDSDCEEGEEPCAETGGCDGRGACALAPAGTQCAPASCDEGVLTSAAFCDGAGVCQPGTEHACPSGSCLGSACAPSGQLPDGGPDGGVDGAGDGGGDGPGGLLVAEAGPVQVVQPGTEVFLDGSASRPHGVLHFVWSQSSGPDQVVLRNPETASPSFFAEREGVYVFRLVVNDGSRDSAPDFTEVHVVPPGAGCGCGGGAAPHGLTALLLLLALVRGKVLAGRGWRPRRAGRARPAARSASLLIPVCVTAGLVAAGIGGCGDDVQGSLRLLLVPPHEGRNPTQDPFELVERVEVGLLGPDGDFQALGSSRPLARFGPGLVAGGRSGVPFVLGLNERGRPVAHGFGPALTLEAGRRQIQSVPFSRSDTASAMRIAGHAPALTDMFNGRAPALFVDHRHVEVAPVDGPGDLSAVATVLWSDQAVFVQVAVTDDVDEPAEAGGVLGDGDAVTIYLGQTAVTVASDGRYEPADVPARVETGRTSAGYLVRLELPLEEPRKNQVLGFDLRLHDRDGDGGVALATWCFDPRREGGAPLPEDFGRLVLGVPLLDLLAEDAQAPAFAVADGSARIEGSWDPDWLVLDVTVEDSQVLLAGEDDPTLEGGDRVEFWLDLANGSPPAAEPLRLVRVVGTPNARLIAAGGDHPDGLSPEVFSFNGRVKGSTVGGGYRIVLELPWSDLEPVGGAVQRGWFLGLEVRVVDVDEQGVGTWSWSGLPDIEPGRWPEVRLFSVE